VYWIQGSVTKKGWGRGRLIRTIGVGDRKGVGSGRAKSLSSRVRGYRTLSGDAEWGGGESSNR